MIWVGVDVGGTFTDAVTYDASSHALQYGKAPSTPDDPAQGVLDVLDKLGIEPGRVARFVHGVTIGTNAILERKFAQVWMLTTAGFRDVLEIARTNRPVLYDIKSLKTPPLVPRIRSHEVNERLMFDGSVRVSLDEEQVREIAAGIDPTAGGAVVICFLHSYANPGHEQAAARIVKELLPGWFVCTSSEVLPKFREYERFCTTALNACIGPLMEGYLGALERELAGRGYREKIYIMTSNGGVSSVERAKRLPVTTVLSGPAGGVAAAVHLGERAGVRNLITCDMGGTSTDVCLIEDLNVPISKEQQIGQYANHMPQIEINSVGAGGGSIAWLDAGDILMVGPRSAGAQPGPACYGQGGTEPTVTDANLMLRRLSPQGRLGGSIGLDEQKARSAVARLGERLPELDDISLGEGIVRIAMARMVSAIKQISVAKGYDPRDFVLLPYGGAGPMHAAFIAEELEIARVLVPLGPGNFAAFGSLISDIRQHEVRTHTLQTRRVDFTEILGMFRRMKQDGATRLMGEGVTRRDIRFVRSLGMRYLGQSWELDVEMPDTVRSIGQLEQAFAEVHERRFGHRNEDATEIVNFQLASIGQVGKPAQPPRKKTGKTGTARAARTGRRPVYFAGRFRDTAVYDRMRLTAQGRVAGPAIIEESGATTVVPPRWQAVVLDGGEIMLERT